MTDDQIIAAAGEPAGLLFQNEETGLVQSVDIQQVEWGFEKNNPRLINCGALYPADAILSAVKPLRERIAELEIERDDVKAMARMHLASIEEHRQQLAAKDQRIALLSQQNANLSALSVTKIMIGISPGEDGIGEEVYATCVDDVEKLIGRLGEKAEDFDLETAPLRTQLNAALAREKVLREALSEARTADDAGWCQAGGYITEVIDAALALPHDGTALRQIVEDEVAKRKEPA